MNRKSGFLVSLLATALFLGSVHEAEAKRLGGGSSFGSKPSYSQPFQHTPSSSALSQPTRSATQQQAATQNQAARQNWSSRGGLMGMLGGLALGGLLGSLFFGGAFESINFMDILLFAGVAFVLFRLFAAKSARQDQPIGNAYGRAAYGENANQGSYRNTDLGGASGGGGFNTDVLFNKNSTQAAIPADFDQQAFLAGAERAFRHLQAAWDGRDLATIRGLSTDKVFAEIQDQLRASTSANKTEVLQLRAELLSVREQGTELESTVLFDAMIREDDDQPQRVREVWHFIKPVSSKQPKWFLDGIQQIVE